MCGGLALLYAASRAIRSGRVRRVSAWNASAMKLRVSVGCSQPSTCAPARGAGGRAGVLPRCACPALRWPRMFWTLTAHAGHRSVVYQQRDGACTQPAWQPGRGECRAPRFAAAHHLRQEEEPAADGAAKFGVKRADEHEPCQRAAQPRGQPHRQARADAVRDQEHGPVPLRAPGSRSAPAARAGSGAGGHGRAPLRGSDSERGAQAVPARPA